MVFAMMISNQFRSNSLAGLPRSSRPAKAQCKARKGFGVSTSKSGGSGSKSGLSKTPQQAADRALAEASKGRPKVRPINPKEAARGKVDYVQVKDWANGEAGDIGELQVVSGSVGTGYTTGSDSATAAADASVPFYQQLGQHAQYLERQGALSIANERNAKPYLPFEAWQYDLQRYMQYLAEVAAVHSALECAVCLALSAPAPPPAAAGTVSSKEDTSLPPVDSSSGGSTPVWAVAGRSSQVLQAYSALQCLGPDSGLWRAAAAQADMQALAGAAAAAAAAAEQSTAPQSTYSSLQPSQNAVAYGKYLVQLGKAAAAATEAAAAAMTASADALVAEESEGVAAALKLVAHAYALQVQQQCLGTRIGAAAADKLQLLSARAFAMYMDYPSSIQGEPVQHFMRVTDAAGQQLDAAGRQAVLDELPKALKKSALMLAPLATAV